jgi:hypothetical protein
MFHLVFILVIFIISFELYLLYRYFLVHDYNTKRESNCVDFFYKLNHKSIMLINNPLTNISIQLFKIIFKMAILQMIYFPFIIISLLNN